MRIQNVIVSTFVLLSASCTPMSTVAPTETLRPASTSIANVQRWQEYEIALAEVFLPRPYLSGTGLCEWEILGQSEREVYVWAICQVAESAEGAAMSAPAVIHLSEDDSIEKVDVPGDGSQYAADIRNMFPKELHEKIFSQAIDSNAMWQHIQARHRNSEPPLIVETGGSLP